MEEWSADIRERNSYKLKSGGVEKIISKKENLRAVGSMFKKTSVGSFGLDKI